MLLVCLSRSFLTPGDVEEGEESPAAFGPSCLLLGDLGSSYLMTYKKIHPHCGDDGSRLDIGLFTMLHRISSCDFPTVLPLPILRSISLSHTEFNKDGAAHHVQSSFVR